MSQSKSYSPNPRKRKTPSTSTTPNTKGKKSASNLGDTELVLPGTRIPEDYKLYYSDGTPYIFGYDPQLYIFNEKTKEYEKFSHSFLNDPELDDTQLYVPYYKGDDTVSYEGLFTKDRKNFTIKNYQELKGVMKTVKAGSKVIRRKYTVRCKNTKRKSKKSYR
jgi:hypothetical protein